SPATETRRKRRRRPKKHQRNEAVLASMLYGDEGRAKSCWRTPLIMTSTFSPREFLRCRHAELVHFSTLMASRMDWVFPDDMGQAMTLTGVPLSFSTIQVGDTNPQMQGRGGAEGSVGILVDIGPGTLIHSVSPSDSGSSLLGSLGLPPSEQNCIDSIDK